MMALIDDTEKPHYAHPMFWAPFVVVGEGGSVHATAPAIPSTKIVNEPQSEERLFWESIKDNEEAASYQAYLDAHPAGLFASQARTKLKKVKTKTQPPTAGFWNVLQNVLAVPQMNETTQTTNEKDDEENSD